jgi:predicted nucleotidyltransferase
VQRALNQLAAQGIVDARQAGRAILYTLNREHLAYPAVEILAGIRSALVTRLRETVEPWEIQPAHASIFGSAARGDGGIDSDIDLFVVRPTGVAEEEPTWRSQLEALVESVWRWTGNRVALSEVGRSDIGRLKRERPPVVAELEKDSIVFAGQPAKDVLRGRR